MTVLKLSESKKALMIITDDGTVYFTSVAFLTGLLNGKSKTGFITTKRLPNKVSTDRFKPSELWDPNGVYKGDAAQSLTTGNDGLSKKSIEEKKEKVMFEDKDVW